MNEFLTKLAQRITHFTGCVGVTCVVADNGRTLEIKSEDGYCNIVLSRHGRTLYEIYGRLSQGGIDLMERIQIVDLLVDSGQ